MSVGVMEDYKQEIYTSPTHWVGRGTGTPKDRDEVKKREVYDCEGWVWDLDKWKKKKVKFTATLNNSPPASRFIIPTKNAASVLSLLKR